MSGKEFILSSASEPLDKQVVARFDFANAQTRLVRAFFIGMILKEMMVGGLMVMFASHVLGFSSGEISLILTLAPLWLVLRYPFLKWVDRLPRFKVLISARLIQVVCVLVLFFLPDAWITPWFLLLLSSIFVFSNEFLLNAVFINTVTEITKSDERGRFLGRLRSRLQSMGLLFSTGVAFFVGEHMSSAEHKVLLVMCLALLINAIFWLWPLHDTPPRPPAPKDQRQFWQVLRYSPLLRRPLILSLIKSLWEWPIVILYMLNSLAMPANIVATFTIVRALGAIVSVTAWGKWADKIGFKRVFIVSFYGAFLLYPMLFLLPDYAQVSVQSTQGLAGLVALLLFGFFSGVISAGQNVGMTLYFTEHLEGGKGFYAINLLSALTQLFLSGLTALGGLLMVYLDSSGLAGANSILGGFIWIDPFRIILLITLFALLLFGLYLACGIKTLPKKIIT